MRKNIYRCTSTLSVLNYCSGILFKSLSYLYEVVRTNFSADFWTFRNFWPQFRENCGATEQRKWELLVHLKGQSILKKRWKPHQNRPTNRHTILVWTMSPTRRQTKRDIQKKTPNFAPTAGARSSISPKLCMVIELIVPIKKVPFIFWPNA